MLSGYRISRELYMCQMGYSAARRLKTSLLSVAVFMTLPVLAQDTGEASICLDCEPSVFESDCAPEVEAAGGGDQDDEGFEGWILEAE